MQQLQLYRPIAEKIELDPIVLPQLVQLMAEVMLTVIAQEREADDKER